MQLNRLLVVGLSVAAVSAGVGAMQQLSTPEAVSTFATSLEACTKARAATAHPLMRTFVIEHTIAGEEDGRCSYTQTMPGRMTMQCKLSPEGRNGLAAEIRAMSEGGPLRGGSSVAAPEWMKACEIVTASGVRTPAVKPR